jgi:hypothetical protein
MRLEPLYRLTFRYPESWQAAGERLLIAEGQAEGRIAGRFRGANRARRRPDGSWLPHLSGAIETEAGTVLLTLSGYGDPKAEPQGRVLASVVHAADGELGWLDGTLGVVCGEVRGGRDVVLDVAELVWEPLPVTI